LTVQAEMVCKSARVRQVDGVSGADSDSHAI